MPMTKCKLTNSQQVEWICQGETPYAGSYLSLAHNERLFTIERSILCELST